MSDEHDDYEDEVGAEGNRIIGGRAKAVVEHVTRSIADEPDAVDVEMIERRGEVSILVHADKGDMGRLIGRRGRVVQALRQVTRAAGAARLEIGRLGRAHGLRGEISVTLTSDRSERLAPGSTLTTDDRELVVRAARPHQQRWLVSFDGIDDRTAAERLQGASLYAEALPTEGDELWVHELIGATVRDPAGTTLGVVEAIEANPASDLLVLDGERLVPLTFVVAHEPGVVTVDVPDGLWD